MNLSSQLAQPTVTLPIIGYVRSPLSQKFGLPRQPNLVDIRCQIELIAPFDNPQAFEGLAEFSHLWVIWQFHQNRESQSTSFRTQVRPPRLGGNEKIGVFATRSMYRPAPIGLSVVKLVEIQQINDKVTLMVSGADMVDGTPVLDIKPYLAYSDNVLEAHSSYADEKPTLKVVKLTDEASNIQQKLLLDNSLSKTDFETITQLIAQDPRPAYRQAEIGSTFKMRYRQFDVVFSMDKEDSLTIESFIQVNS